jgi:hypothetical protein
VAARVSGFARAVRSGLLRGALKSVFAGGLSLAGAVHAAMVEYSTSFTSQASAYSSPFSFQLFNPSLGTLNSVVLSLSSNLTGGVQVYSTLAGNTAFTNASSEVPVTVSVSAPGDVSAWVSGPARFAMASGTAVSGVNQFKGSSSTAVSTTVNVEASEFQDYTGTGTAQAMFSVGNGNGTYGGTGVPGLFFGGMAFADGLFSVNYTYTEVSAVPLPPAGWLLLSGLVSMALIKRRRQRPDG